MRTLRTSHQSVLAMTVALSLPALLIGCAGDKYAAGAKGPRSLNWTASAAGADAAVVYQFSGAGNEAAVLDRRDATRKQAEATINTTNDGFVVEDGWGSTYLTRHVYITPPRVTLGPRAGGVFNSPVEYYVFSAPGSPSSPGGPPRLTRQVVNGPSSQLDIQVTLDNPEQGQTSKTIRPGEYVEITDADGDGADEISNPQTIGLVADPGKLKEPYRTIIGRAHAALGKP